LQAKGGTGLVTIVKRWKFFEEIERLTLLCDNLIDSWLDDPDANGKEPDHEEFPRKVGESDLALKFYCF
ncbi:MAG: hypothetical protein AAFO69_18315, partial [Bacteroidota bacterium]